jgi:hypothetical protein|tara:strand:+ start:242 stop:646 length:405 start_codon:yes stop_codon:yes gene_type:complete
MTKMKMKNSEFVELFNGLAAVQQLKGVKFGLLVSKNVRTIQKELDYLEDASKPSDEFVALSVQMNQLMNDKNEKEVKALEKKNAKLIQERKDQLAELEKLMEEEVELELLEIPEDCLPEDISGEQIINIDKIIA